MCNVSSPVVESSLDSEGLVLALVKKSSLFPTLMNTFFDPFVWSEVTFPVPVTWYVVDVCLNYPIPYATDRSRQVFQKLDTTRLCGVVVVLMYMQVFPSFSLTSHRYDIFKNFLFAVRSIVVIFRGLMANTTLISCSNLASRTDFSSYVAAVRSTTGNDISLVSVCRTEVCNALWGSGNPDISGIGVDPFPALYAACWLT